MTIFTAGNADKPKEAKVLINPETMVKVEFKGQRDAAARQQRKMHAAINELIRNRRRRYLAMNIVVAIASLLVVITGIFGGMYIYKWVTYSTRVSAEGECTVRYHEEMRVDAQPQLQAQPRPPRRGSAEERKPWLSQIQQRLLEGNTDRFVERYNVISPEQEIIQVPQTNIGSFGLGSLPINVIHDFNAKLTAIVDVWNNRCFVKPLDPNVVPPRDFIDLVRRMEDGTYMPNVCLIRKHYRTQQPSLSASGLQSLRSEIIYRSCIPFTTYQLVRTDSPSTPSPMTTRRMLIGGGNEDFYRQRGSLVQVEDEPPVVLGGETDPDNPRNQASRQLSKRSAEAVNEENQIDVRFDDPPKIIKKGNVLDDDDIAMNLGFAGEEVELAFIHFDHEAEEDMMV